MARRFSHELSSSATPTDAIVQLRGALAERLRGSAAMKLARQDASSLCFRPALRFPVLVWIYRVATGERIDVTATGAEQGARLAVSGKVGGKAQFAADRELWAEAIGGSQ
jgi:hypothetical protein